MAEIVIGGSTTAGGSGAAADSPPPVEVPSIIPPVKPVSITMSVDARQVIDATVGQLETTGSTLMSEAIKEAIALGMAALDPLAEKYMGQLLAAMPALIHNAIHHLLVEDPEVKQLYGKKDEMATVPTGLAAEVERLLADAEEVTAALESVGDLPGVNKVEKYVVDVDKVLHIVSTFLSTVEGEVTK